MPWVCPSCDSVVTQDDVSTCPGCGSSKSAWTMHADRTRTLVVGRKRIELQRGVSADEVPPGHASHSGADVVPATHAYALSKREAQAIADAGKLPASHDVLFVRLFPGGSPERGVTIAVNFDHHEVEELPPAHPDDPALDAAGKVDVKFLFVWGDDPAVPLPTFPGLHVVDVSEESDDGWTHAPSIAVEALKKTGELPVERVAEPAMVLSL